MESARRFRGADQNAAAAIIRCRARIFTASSNRSGFSKFFLKREGAIGGCFKRLSESVSLPV